MLTQVEGCPESREYVCPGETVQYLCSSQDDTHLGTTRWDGNGDDTLFTLSADCSGTINLSHLHFNETGMEFGSCGTSSAEIYSNADDCYRSNFTFNATTNFKGAMVRCRFQSSQIGSIQELDVVGNFILSVSPA